MLKANWKVMNLVIFFRKFESRIHCVNNILKPPLTPPGAFFNGDFNPLPLPEWIWILVFCKYLAQDAFWGKKFQAKVVLDLIHLTPAGLGKPLGLGENMMVLIDRKCNEEQLLLKTFFPKMHIQRDIGKKVISRRLKHPIKKI